MYKVIYKFADLQDKKHVYNIGDIYPREGTEPPIERVKELAGISNRLGRPLISKVAEDVPSKPTKAVEPSVEEKPKPKRGRKKKADSEE